MEEELRGYYAVIPASVRYDERLAPSTKLLYGEITALSNEKGYCWATNKYFAELYRVEPQTISRWISKLKECGHINVEIIYKENTKEIVNRYISVNDTPINKIVNTPINKKVNTPINKNVKDNNTYLNNTYIEKEIYKERKHKYGTYKNVLLSDNELETLKNEFTDYEERIERVSEYCASKGKSYKNYLATIRNWARKEKVDKQQDSLPNYEIDW